MGVLLTNFKWGNLIEMPSREILVETDSTLKVITVDERVVVVEYEESLCLESSGTVNV